MVYAMVRQFIIGLAGFFLFFMLIPYGNGQDVGVAESSDRTGELRGILRNRAGRALPNFTYAFLLKSENADQEKYKTGVSRFFGITGPGGEFEETGLPEGTYRLEQSAMRYSCFAGRPPAWALVPSVDLQPLARVQTGLQELVVVVDWPKLEFRPIEVDAPEDLEVHAFRWVGILGAWPSGEPAIELHPYPDGVFRNRISGAGTYSLRIRHRDLATQWVSVTSGPDGPKKVLTCFLSPKQEEEYGRAAMPVKLGFTADADSPWINFQVSVYRGLSRVPVLEMTELYFHGINQANWFADGNELRFTLQMGKYQAVALGTGDCLQHPFANRTAGFTVKPGGEVDVPLELSGVGKLHLKLGCKDIKEKDGVVTAKVWLDSGIGSFIPVYWQGAAMHDSTGHAQCPRPEWPLDQDCVSGSVPEGTYRLQVQFSNGTQGSSVVQVRKGETTRLVFER